MIVRLLFILRRRWPILFVIPLLTGVAGYVFTPRGEAVKAVYYTTRVLIAAREGAASPTAIQQTLIDAKVGPIADATAALLGEGVTKGDVSNRVSGRFEDESYTIILSVTGATPEESQRYADAVRDTFIMQANEGPQVEYQQRMMTAITNRDEAQRLLQTYLEANAGAIAQEPQPEAVAQQLKQLQTALEQAENRLAEAESLPDPGEIYRFLNMESPRITGDSKLQLPASAALRVSFGVIFGILGAVVLVALVEKLNPRIDDPDHASALIGAPVLAMVPVMGRRRRNQITRADPEHFRGPFAESFRSARSHLDYRTTAEERDLPPRIMVTSATPAEGKSTTSAFLALAYAEVGRPPIVVGGDLRRPSIHKFFGVERIPGLTSRLTSAAPAVPMSSLVAKDPVSGVSVIPSGPSVDRVTGLLGDLVSLTEAGQSIGRVVLLDTAPVMVANDAIDFLSAVDWVVVVVRVGRSTERSVKQMMQTLSLNEAKVAGVIMVGSLESTDAKRYYYSYYSDEKPTRTKPEPVDDLERTLGGVLGEQDADD